MWGRLRARVWPIALGIIALLPFVWTLNDPFVSDDWNFLWLADTRGFSISEIVRTNTEGGEVGGSYRPLVTVFWRALYQVAGTNPLPYRLATIGFHVVNVLLVYFLLQKIFTQRQIPRAIAGLAALLFALTPSKAEIAWVSVVNDTLATLLLLLSSWAYMAALVKTQWKQAALFTLAGGLAFGALMTKEFAVIIPVMIGALAWVYGKKFATIVWHSGLAAGVVAIFLAVRYAAIGLLASDYTGTLTLTVYQVWRAYISYTVAFFVSGLPRAWITAHWLLNLWLGNGAAIIVVGLSVWILRRTRLVFLGVAAAALYLLSIAPVVRFAIENSLRYVSDEGERFVYFPSLFLSVLVATVGWSFFQTFGRDRFKKTAAVLGVVALLGMSGVLGLKTWRWHQAAHLAGRLVDQGAALISNNTYAGYVVVGLPDQFHGAQIFRNAYPFALALRLPGSDVPAKHLIASRLHTLYAPTAEKFTLTKKSATEFAYQHPKPLINSPVGFTSSDYTLTNNGFLKEKYGISIPTITTSTVMAFSPQFVQTNQGQAIAIMYFNGVQFALETL